MPPVSRVAAARGFSPAWMAASTSSGRAYILLLSARARADQDPAAAAAAISLGDRAPSMSEYQDRAPRRGRVLVFILHTCIV